LIKLVLNSVYPSPCINCESLFEFDWQNCICKRCIELIKKEKNLPYCKSCGDGVENCENCKTKTYYNDIEVYCSFKGAIKNLIYEYKLSNRRNLSKIIAEKIEEDIKSYIKDKRIEMIIYVPLHKSIEKQRGFNHLKEILVHILPPYLISDQIEKTRNTKLQTELPKEKRLRNLKNAFRLKKQLKAKNILIFDDVLTTGSTLLELYSTIKNSGYSGNIYGYVITKS